MSSTISYTHPTKTLNGGKLTFDQIQQWRSEGYALVDGLISDQLAGTLT